MKTRMLWLDAGDALPVASTGPLPSCTTTPGSVMIGESVRDRCHDLPCTARREALAKGASKSRPRTIIRHAAECACATARQK